MSNTKILKILRKFKTEHSDDYGIIMIGIFGSYARNITNPASDIDVVVKVEKQDLFNIIGIKQDLESIFKTSVDVISYRQNMNQYLKNRIEKEAIYV